jgi:hypothetical protein
MAVAPKRPRYDPIQLCFHLIRGPPRRKTRAVADSENMRVDRECLLAEGRVEDHVRCLAADAGKGLQLLPGARHSTAMMIDERLRKCDHVLRLRVVQADRPDLLAKSFFAQVDHLLRRLHTLEQVSCRKIDTCICRLGGKDDRHEQSVGIDVIELGRGRGIRLRQPTEELEDPSPVHSSLMTSRIE